MTRDQNIDTLTMAYADYLRGLSSADIADIVNNNDLVRHNDYMALDIIKPLTVQADNWLKANKGIGERCAYCGKELSAINDAIGTARDILTELYCTI